MPPETVLASTPLAPFAVETVHADTDIREPLGHGRGGQDPHVGHDARPVGRRRNIGRVIAPPDQDRDVRPVDGDFDVAAHNEIARAQVGDRPSLPIEDPYVERNERAGGAENLWRWWQLLL
jgi:hypothetical protein